MSNQPDAYGNIGGPNPHNSIIVGSNGIPLAQRSRIILGSGLAATDMPASDGTSINTVPSTDPTAPVRLALYQAASQGAGTTWTGPTWAANAYRRLQLIIRCDDCGGGGPDHVNFVGPSGTYQTSMIYINGATTVGIYSGSATFYLSLAGSAGFSCFGTYDIAIPTSASKKFKGSSELFFNGAYNQGQLIFGQNDDAVNPVTGLNVVFGAGGATGAVEIELIGYP